MGHMDLSNILTLHLLADQPSDLLNTQWIGMLTLLKTKTLDAPLWNPARPALLTSLAAPLWNPARPCRQAQICSPTPSPPLCLLWIRLQTVLPMDMLDTSTCPLIPLLLLVKKLAPPSNPIQAQICSPTTSPPLCLLWIRLQTALPTQMLDTSIWRPMCLILLEAPISINLKIAR